MESYKGSKKVISAKNDVDLQALNKFAGSKSFFACKCGRKWSQKMFHYFATFLYSRINNILSRNARLFILSGTLAPAAVAQ